MEDRPKEKVSQFLDALNVIIPATASVFVVSSGLVASKDIVLPIGICASLSLLISLSSYSIAENLAEYVKPVARFCCFGVLLFFTIKSMDTDQYYSKASNSKLLAQFATYMSFAATLVQSPSVVDIFMLYYKVLLTSPTTKT